MTGRLRKTRAAPSKTPYYAASILSIRLVRDGKIRNDMLNLLHKVFGSESALSDR